MRASTTELTSGRMVPPPPEPVPRMPGSVDVSGRCIERSGDGFVVVGVGVVFGVGDVMTGPAIEA